MPRGRKLWSLKEQQLGDRGSPNAFVVSRALFFFLRPFFRFYPVHGLQDLSEDLPLIFPRLVQSMAYGMQHPKLLIRFWDNFPDRFLQAGRITGDEDPHLLCTSLRDAVNPFEKVERRLGCSLLRRRGRR